jgi:hypothetical protein
MQRGDPVDEPWYEIEFRMTRWRCPEGVSGPLLDDIIEATQETDRLLLDALKFVDSYAYGLDSNPIRYLRYSHIEQFKSDFEQMEDRLLIAKSGLARRWSLLMAKHKELMSDLSFDLKSQLHQPDVCYDIGFETKEVEIDDTLKQFLDGIQPGN